MNSRLIFPKILTAGILALALNPNAQAISLQHITSFATTPTGAEILAFDRNQKLLYSTYGAPGNAGVQVIDFSQPSSPSNLGNIPMNSIDGRSAATISSVAADPLNRGFGIATFIPQTSGSDLGKVAFFNPITQTVVKTLDVGYHPDSVKFSSDGTKVFIANEGEPVTEGGVNHFDRPGSISIIDLSSVASTGDLAALTPASVQTYDFSTADLSGIRVHPANSAPAARQNDVEPESMTQVGDKLYVALQENNAIAEFDLTTRTWTRISNLGTLLQTIDASDRDGAGGTRTIQINDVVAGLPMPDGISSFSVAGKSYILSANEGDARRPDGATGSHPITNDDARFADLGSSGRPSLDPATDAALDLLYGGDAQAASALGRLRVSLIDGNTDVDADIEVPTMLGTRSFSIWDATTGALVWDSGSDFETITAAEVPTLYNSSGDAASFDLRSPNKGPEPEMVASGEINGRYYAFIGLERTSGVMMYDITVPTSPRYVDFINTGEFGPEGLEFIPASISPTGYPLLTVGYEVSSIVGVYGFVPDAAPWIFPTALLALAAFSPLRRR